MSHLYSSSLLLCVILLFSCGKRDKKMTIKNTDSIEQEAKNLRMQEYFTHDTVMIASEKYLVDIHLQPCDSLPKVKDDSGKGFSDNTITLTIKKMNGNSVFYKVFTKKNFSNIIPADFLKKSILDGLVFDKVEAGKFAFAGSVSYPQSDMSMPVTIIITRTGKTSIQVDEVMDNSSDQDSI
jgi:hypothetical protein